MFQKLTDFRKRVFRIIEIGSLDDYPSRAYDFINMLAIVVNLTLSILYTFEEFREPYGRIALTIEAMTVAFFALDYLLRLFTAKVKYAKCSEARADQVYLFLWRFGGFVFFSAVLSAGIFSVRRGGVPHVPRCAHFPPVPYHSVL